MTSRATFRALLLATAIALTTTHDSLTSHARAQSAPPSARPFFVVTGAPYPSTISIGQTFSVTVTVRNDGADSDDGRIVMGFPSLAMADAAQFVESYTPGDAPGYFERPVGSQIADASCRPMEASYLVVEWSDRSWVGGSVEYRAVTAIVQPRAPGTFVFDLRATMRSAGAGPCAYVNGLPAAGESGAIDQQGWPVQRFAVTVVPQPPQPVFFENYSVLPGSNLTLGESVTIRTRVRNMGGTSDDGRIVMSFPNLTVPSDTSWVDLTAAPGYRKIPAGSTILRNDCTPIIAPCLSVEYADTAWSGAGGEVGELVVVVHPPGTGTFPILLRSTMHSFGADPGACAYVNGGPPGGTLLDPQGWAACVINLYVSPPPPTVAGFTGPVVVSPGAITLGENVRITATLRNDGAHTTDGRLVFGFPNLTDENDHPWVASGSGGDLPGYQETPAGQPLTNAACQPVPARYLTAEYVDSDWARGESNTVTVMVQPRTTGLFPIDVRGTLRDTAALAPPCKFANATPAEGVPAVDPQGFAVRRLYVTVTAPPGPPATATTQWATLVPPPGGPGGRTSASAAYDTRRNELIIYGGADPIYRPDVWALPMAEGGAWHHIVAGGPIPLRRTMHTMIYNALDDQTVVFGGLYDDFLNDMTVLTLSGNPWWFPNPGSGTPPSPRGGHAAIYDARRNRMLVIGGFGGGSVKNDVWEYAPAGVGMWRELTVIGAPMPARAQHTAIYDPVRDRVLVFGGDGGTFLNDVWALQLSNPPTWLQLTPAGTPPSGRREHAAIHDPAADRMIVFGGFDGTTRGDLWALKLDGTPTWTRLYAATVGPARRYGHAAAYDASRHRMVVYGGSLGGIEVAQDMWTLGLDEPTPVTLSLVSTEVERGRVRLVWAGGEVAGLHTTLYRADGEQAPWTVIGRPVVEEGGERLVFVDRAVEAGQRYGYKLVVRTGFGDVELAEEWVTVPERAVLGLAGASPNPSEGELHVAFSLADEQPATLELFDLTGRKVAGRAVGGLGPGAHRVSLGPQRLPAGVYLVRLTRGADVLQAKAAIVR